MASIELRGQTPVSLSTLDGTERLMLIDSNDTVITVTTVDTFRQWVINNSDLPDTIDEIDGLRAELDRLNLVKLESPIQIDDVQALQAVLNTKYDASTAHIDDRTITIGDMSVTVPSTLGGAIDDRLPETSNIGYFAIFVGLDGSIGQIAPENVKDGIGLGDVDNTSDADKPISDATQTALDDKVDDTQVLTDVPENALFTDTPTDLSITRNDVRVDIDSSTGSDVSIPSADNFNAGVLTANDKQHIDSIEEGAQVTNTINVWNALGISSLGSLTRILTERGVFVDITSIDGNITINQISVTKEEVDAAIGASSTGDASQFYNERGEFIEPPGGVESVTELPTGDLTGQYEEYDILFVQNTYVDTSFGDRTIFRGLYYLNTGFIDDVFIFGWSLLARDFTGVINLLSSRVDDNAIPLRYTSSTDNDYYVNSGITKDSGDLNISPTASGITTDATLVGTSVNEFGQNITTETGVTITTGDVLVFEGEQQPEWRAVTFASDFDGDGVFNVSFATNPTLPVTIGSNVYRAELSNITNGSGYVSGGQAGDNNVVINGSFADLLTDGDTLRAYNFITSGIGVVTNIRATSDGTTTTIEYDGELNLLGAGFGVSIDRVESTFTTNYGDVKIQNLPTGEIADSQTLGLDSDGNVVLGEGGGGAGVTIVNTLPIGDLTGDYEIGDTVGIADDGIYVLGSDADITAVVADDWDVVAEATPDGVVTETNTSAISGDKTFTGLVDLTDANLQGISASGITKADVDQAIGTGVADDTFFYRGDGMFSTVGPFRTYTLSGTPSLVNSVPKWTADNQLVWSSDVSGPGALNTLSVSGTVFDGSQHLIDVTISGGPGADFTLSVINANPTGWVSNAGLGNISGTIPSTGFFNTTMVIPATGEIVDRTFQIQAVNDNDAADIATSPVIRQQHTPVQGHDLLSIHLDDIHFTSSTEFARITLTGVSGTQFNFSIIQTSPTGWITAGALSATSGTIPSDGTFEATITIPTALETVNRTFRIRAINANNAEDTVTSSVIRQQHTVAETGNLAADVVTTGIVDASITATVTSGNIPYDFVLSTHPTDPTMGVIESSIDDADNTHTFTDVYNYETRTLYVHITDNDGDTLVDPEPFIINVAPIEPRLETADEDVDLFVPIASGSDIQAFKFISTGLEEGTTLGFYLGNGEIFLSNILGLQFINATASVDVNGDVLFTPGFTVGAVDNATSNMRVFNETTSPPTLIYDREIIFRSAVDGVFLGFGEFSQSVTTSSISVDLKFSRDSVGTTNVTANIYSDSTLVNLISSQTLSSVESSFNIVTFTGLDPNTTYYITATGGGSGRIRAFTSGYRVISTLSA